MSTFKMPSVGDVITFENDLPKFSYKTKIIKIGNYYALLNEETNCATKLDGAFEVESIASLLTSLEKSGAKNIQIHYQDDENEKN